MKNTIITRPVKTRLFIQGFIKYWIVLLLMTSCLGYKELPVEYDYSYRGQFKRYRTFTLMVREGVDADQANEIIEKSIISRMRFLGYSQSTKRPQLLIGYKIFPDSLSLRGYNQPELEEYLKGRVSPELEYNAVKVDMSTGSLAIQFYDPRLNRTIWQGYAVGLSRTLDFSNTRQLRNAVISILDQYRVWADGFLEASQAVQEN